MPGIDAAATKHCMFVINDQHALKVAGGSCEEVLSQLQRLPSLAELFCEPDNTIAVNGEPFRGLAFFADGLVPMWEHSSVEAGCDVVWSGGILPAAQLQQCVTFLLAYVATTEGCCGCRIINKNRQGMGMTKIEVWFATTDAAQSRLVALRSAVAKCTALPGANNQFRRITTHRSKLQRCH